MATQNIFVYFFVVLAQLFRDLALLPIWWYTRGLVNCLRWCLNFIGDWWKSLALGVWIKYLFVPMYGQRDFSGRLISFMMRFVQIILRGIIFLIWIAVSCLIFAIYLSLPILIVSQIILQINGLYVS
jgi:hypothetical protein